MSDRRTFLKEVAAAGAALATGTLLEGCSRTHFHEMDKMRLKLEAGHLYDRYKEYFNIK